VTDLVKLRALIEQKQREVSAAEGEERALSSEIEKELQEMRKELSCAPGKEADSFRELRSQIEAEEKEISTILDGEEVDGAE
jgi:hypothetical protein